MEHGFPYPRPAGPLSRIRVETSQLSAGMGTHLRFSNLPEDELYKPKGLLSDGIVEYLRSGESAASIDIIC